MRRRTALKTLAGGAAGLAAAGAVPVRARAGYAPFGRLDVGAGAEAVVDDAGETAYLATLDGFVSVDISDPESPTRLAEQTVMADFDGGPVRGVADVSIDGDRVLAAGPYQGAGRLNGVALYDVSDPADPERVAAMETDDGHHNVHYRDGIAYVTQVFDDRERLVVLDARDGRFRERGSWGLLDHSEEWAEVEHAGTPIHDLWAHEDRVYLARWDAGTFVVDVSDLDAPEFVAKVGGYAASELKTWSRNRANKEFFEPPGNHHFVTVNEDASLLGVGKEAWDIPETEDGGPGGVDLWDITDPTAAEKLSTIDPPPSPQPTFELPDTTAHNFEIRGDRLFTSWYNGGVKIHDISDPTAPEQLAWWRKPEEASFWTARFATEEFFVASSTNVGRRTTVGGLYTFPNEPGEQTDPPGTFSDRTPTSDGTSPDGSPTATDGDTADGAGDGGTATATEETPASSPGLGVGATVGGAALAAWRLVRR